MVSWDREKVLQMGPAYFALRFDSASRIYINLKDEFSNLENKCIRLNLFKHIPAD